MRLPERKKDLTRARIYNTSCYHHKIRKDRFSSQFLFWIAQKVGWRRLELKLKNHPDCTESPGSKPLNKYKWSIFWRCPIPNINSKLDSGLFIKSKRVMGRVDQRIQLECRMCWSRFKSKRCPALFVSGWIPDFRSSFWTDDDPIIVT